MKKVLYIFFILMSCSEISLGQSLKLMTYNIRLNTESDSINKWDNRREFLCDQIIFYNPDILGVQEALPEQVIYMKNKLSTYNYFGKAREGEEKGESSGIFFDNFRFTLFDEGTFWLSETPDDISKGWDAACHRVCTYGLFYDKQNKNFFWVFNTHLDHVGEIARTKSIELILEKIKKLNTNNYPVFLMGDFNSGTETDRIINLKKIMNDSREISVNKPFGPSGTFNGFKFHQAASELIDYIFISKDDAYKVLKYGILSDSKDCRYPSDHFPVLIQVNYNK
jgi:endonuclease/exonuclease/phosphatase family metal-dependent hydrolase